MDIIHTIKSIFLTIKNVKTDYSKIHVIFEEPINIIDNLYYCSEFNFNNESVIRDYNFKNIIYIGNSDSVIPSNFNNSHYHNIILDYETIDQNFILNQVELINKLQLLDDPNSDIKINIMIHSDSMDKIYFILTCLLVCKYNFTIKKAIRYLEKSFNYKKNTIKFNDQIIEKLSEL